MNWLAAIGIISSVALLLPVIIIIIFGFLRYKNYQALLMYCLLAFVYNLMTEDIIIAPGNIEKTWGVINNLFDVPLMLLFLMLFSTSAAQTFRLKIYLAVFVCFELIVLSLYGLSIKTITIVMGPGLVLILLIASFFFFVKVKQSIIHKKAIGRAFLTAAIVFAYGCFSFIYVMHYILALPDVSNIFLIYYLVTIVYCSLLSTGLIIEKKRVKKLGELQVTRKELMQFFNDERKPATPRDSGNAQWKLN
jgi:hypothetical protein